MTESPSTPAAPWTLVGEGYRSGECNIGPAEIARRRQAGHVGVGASVALLVGLMAVGAPRASRLLIALPAAVAASGYLQARLRFCAGFGSRGVYNFGEVGQTVAVEDTESLERDRARSRQIGLASGAIGLAVGVATLGLPR